MKNPATTDRTTDGEPAEASDVEQVAEPADSQAPSTPAADREEAPSEAGDADRAPADTTATGSELSDDSVSGRGWLAGAGAIVSVGLGVVSLTGTAVGDMLRSRKEIIGQIEASTGGGGDQVEAFYGAPWHTAAVVNGIFALFAVAIGGVLVAVYARRSDTRSWVKAAALAGTLLGVLGLVVAVGMYLNLFGAQPTLPAVPPGAGG